MEKKLSFNENADNYDRLRLRNCQELFADIAAYAGLQARLKRRLEYSES